MASLGQGDEGCENGMFEDPLCTLSKSLGIHGADVPIYPLGNFIMDIAVRPSHGWPNGHCLHPCPSVDSVRPSLSVRLTTLVNEHLPETRTLLSWSTPRFLTIHGLVCPSCEVLEPFIRCYIHPNVFYWGACTESELGGSLLHKQVCSKMLSLNNTIKINGNQTFERQFNTTQFNEASMQNEDCGKELTVKVLFRGEQRWRRFMQSHTLCVSKPYSTQYPRMVDFASTWNGWMIMIASSSWR
jgi:hypothetical protein